MRLARRALWVGGLLFAICACASLAAFFALYVPAARAVSVALAAIPPDLRPLSQDFERTTLCVHTRGVAHLAARRLLFASGNAEGRAIVWSARYFVWTKAIEWGSADEGLTLFANTMVHKAGAGLSLGAHAYFQKSPSDLTPAEVLELIAADWSPQGVSPNLLKTWRQRCL